jgi:hypothetical protein
LVRGGGPIHGWLTSVYGFFGTVMQRRIELAHTLNDIHQLGKAGEITAAAKQMPKLLTDFMTYVVLPTAIEEWVTSLTTEDREGWGTYLGKASIKGIASSFLYFRDIIHAFTTGQEPGVGLLSSPLHDLAKAYKDTTKLSKMFSRERAGKTVEDLLTVVGEGTGMVPKVAAHAARFGIDYANRQIHPRGPAEVARGVTRGKPERQLAK